MGTWGMCEPSALIRGWVSKSHAWKADPRDGMEMHLPDTPARKGVGGHQSAPSSGMASVERLCAWATPFQGERHLKCDPVWGRRT